MQTKYKMMIINPEFVEFIPKELEERVLYISMRFRTAVHKCACGCGNKAVTRFSPTDWKLIFNGKTVSLYPSIGNWGFPCQSHYWIKNNKIVWDKKRSKEEINSIRRQDYLEKKNYYKEEVKTSNNRFIKLIKFIGGLFNGKS